MLSPSVSYPNPERVVMVEKTAYKRTESDQLQDEKDVGKSEESNSFVSLPHLTTGSAVPTRRVLELARAVFCVSVCVKILRRTLLRDASFAADHAATHTAAHARPKCSAFLTASCQMVLGKDSNVTPYSSD